MLWLWVEAMLVVLIAAFALIFVLTSTYVYEGLIGVFVLLGCLGGLLLWNWTLHCERIGDIDSEATVRNQRQAPSSQNLNLLSLVSQAHFRGLAIRALPPILCFQGDQATQTQCSICIEEFKNGELVQPFAVCLHQFHLDCINSWLFVGKTNCPVCRQHLSIATQTTH